MKKITSPRFFLKGLAFALFATFYFGCIKEDDGTPAVLNLPSISISDLTLMEGDNDDTIQFVVTLSGANNTNAVVKFAGVAGTAAPVLDFEVLTPGGQLVFAPGETQKYIDIRIVSDEAKEAKETFQVKLFNPINVNLAKDLATITVEDDDDNTAGLVIPTTGYTTPTTYPNYTLAWADEFDADTLDKNNWTFETGDGCPGNCGWGNNELQYYREDNTSFVNGNLVITAKKQDFGNRQYTSSRLVTKGKKQFKFGRIDIRAALPKEKAFGQPYGCLVLISTP